MSAKMIPIDKLHSIIAEMEDNGAWYLFNKYNQVPEFYLNHIHDLKKLRVMLEAPASKPQVKKLEWVQISGAMWKAIIIPEGEYGIASYFIYNYGDDFCIALGTVPNLPHSYLSLEAAKASCQAHFEQLILGCLEG